MCDFSEGTETRDTSRAKTKHGRRKPFHAAGLRRSCGAVRRLLAFEPLEHRMVLSHFAHAIVDINADRSDLDDPPPPGPIGDPGDPDGASGGRVNGLSAVPGDNQVFYAASEWGGLYKSTDGGANWSHLEEHLPKATWDVEVDPGNTNRVYATSFYNGLLNPISGIQISHDGGSTWIHPATAHPATSLENTPDDNTPQTGFSCAIAMARNEPSAFGISVRPDAPENVFIGTNCGVARSANSGFTWQFLDPTATVPGVAANPAGTVWDVVVQSAQPGFPQGIIDVVGTMGHRRSTDGGNTWIQTNLPAGATAGAGRSSIAVSPDEPYVLVVAGSDNNLYETDNANMAGAAWTNLGNTDPLLGGGRIPFVVTNDRALGFDVWTGGVGLYRVFCTTPPAPAPGGGTRCPTGQNPLPVNWNGPFTRAASNPPSPAGSHDDVGDIVFDTQAAVDAIPLVMAGDGGVYRNVTPVPTAAPNNPGMDLIWEQPNVSPHALWLFGMDVVDQAGVNAEDIYIGLQDNGSLASTQGGAPLAVLTPSWHNQDCCDVFDIAADDDTVLYTFGAFANTPRPFRLFLGNQGLAASAEVNTYPGNVPNGAMNAAAGGQVTQFNFAESIDTWGDDRYVVLTRDFNPALVENNFGDGGVHLTTDITQNPIVWTELTEPAGMNSAQFQEVQVAMAGGTPSFYVQVGNGDRRGGDQLWRFVGTAPNAANWVQIDTNIPGGAGIGTFAVDPNDPNRLYASTIIPAVGPQMWFSQDAGVTWMRDNRLEFLMNGAGGFRGQTTLGPTNFTGFAGYPQPSFIAFDPENTDNIAAGGVDSGVFLSTDQGQSWRLLTDPYGSDPGTPHLPRPYFAQFDHEPAGTTQLFIGTQGRGVWRIGVDFNLDPDTFEPNDTQGTATVLGSLKKITLRDVNIHHPKDIDFYKYTAQDTGKLIVNMFFDGLRGDLDLRVRDVNGNIIETGLQSNILPELDTEQLVIPVVTQEEYWIEVLSTVKHTNYYSLEIENFSAPVPSTLHLDPASDSGLSSQDHITNDTTPTFFVLADLMDFHQMGVETLTASEAQAGLTAGAAVQVLVIGTDGTTTSGFADPVPAPVPADGTSLFQFTPSSALAEGIYFVAAAVRIFDAQVGPVSGRSLLSESLWITIDTTPPNVSIISIDPANSDTGVSGFPDTVADRVTSDTATAFLGRAEAGATVRLHVDSTSNNTIDTPTQFSVTQSVPIGGSGHTNAGQWQTAYIRNLNDPSPPDSFSLDGLREVLVTAEDIAGNVNTVDDGIGDADQVLDIFVDTQGPRITDVDINGQGNAYDLFDPKPSEDGPTPLVDSLVISVSDLPNRDSTDPNFLYDALLEQVAEEEGHYRLVGDHNGVIPIDAVGYVQNPQPAQNAQPSLGTITLTFIEPLPDDRFTLTISDAVVDPVGNALDGENNAVQPQEAPGFPTGDGQPSGAFVARFTIDSRPELGVWAASSAWVDTNGNRMFDPGNTDFVNRDIVYSLAFASDDVFAGNFAAMPGDSADGFDKLAAYGRFDGTFRWLIDTDNDGVPDIRTEETPPAGVDINGLPVAGNFDGNAANGDEIGIFTGTEWFLDTDHDFLVSDDAPIPVAVSAFGHPFVGDFNGDGTEDLGIYVNDVFSIALGPVVNFAPTDEFRFGFIGVRERPIVADFDQDGFDDIGLWVPDREGVPPREGSEWYILVSDGASVLDRIETPATDPAVDPDTQPPLVPGVISYTPIPFGPDIYAQFGDEFASPVVGNFDPPSTLSRSFLAGDADRDFDFDQFDVAQVLSGDRYLTGQPAGWGQGDWNGDGVFDQLDMVAALATRNYLQGPYAAHSRLDSSGQLVKREGLNEHLNAVDDVFASQ